MNRVHLLVLTVGVSVIVGTAWLTFPRQARSKRDPSKFRFMHCPQCMRESMYSPSGYEKPCMHCDKPLVATVESVSITGASRNPYGRMFALILVEANVVLGILVYLLYHPPPPPETVQYYTNCPNRKCKRRMRYPANRAGAEAQCPLCKTRFVNPTLEEQAALDGQRPS
jgi:hypothetical protein